MAGSAVGARRANPNPPSTLLATQLHTPRSRPDGRTATSFFAAHVSFSPPPAASQSRPSRQRSGRCDDAQRARRRGHPPVRVSGYVSAEAASLDRSAASLDPWRGRILAALSRASHPAMYLTQDYLARQETRALRHPQRADTRACETRGHHDPGLGLRNMFVSLLTGTSRRHNAQRITAGVPFEAIMCESRHQPMWQRAKGESR